MKEKLKITERGFAGHFCASQHCLYHRNTLIEYGDKRIVVSTVGNYQPPYLKDKSKKSDIDNQIGYGRYYETMAFKAKWEEPYWEAEVSSEIPFESDWTVNELEFDSDAKADIMHDNVVKELSKTIKLTPASQDKE